MAIITVGNNPVPIVAAGEQSCTIYNRDITNSVIFGPDSGISGGSASNLNEYSIIDPLGSVTVDGSVDLYASTLAQGTSANVDVMYGVTQVGVSPLLIAEQISASGIYAVNNSVLALNTPSATVIPASSNTTFGPFTFNQPSYEIAFSISVPNSAALPFCQIEMTWTDSVSGQTVSVEDWWVSCGATGAAQSYYGSGPTKGDTLSITVTNFLTSNSATLGKNVQLAFTSRSLQRDDWRSGGTPTIPSFSNATYDEPGNVFMSTAPTVAAQGTATRMLLLYAGAVEFSFVPPSNSGSMGHFNVSAISMSNSNLTALTVFQSAEVGGVNSQLNATVQLPRAVCVVNIFNDVASGGGTFSLFGTIAEQPL